MPDSNFEALFRLLPKRRNASPVTTEPRVTTPIEPRYVRRGTKITAASLCKACGATSGTRGLCNVVACMACQTPLCGNDSIAPSVCPVCCLGIVPSQITADRECDGALCNAPAVAWLLGRALCEPHFSSRKPKYIAAQLKTRFDNFRVCDEVEA